ncbi:MAG: ribbon-helix-helix protein, CopG family [Deltaproteobacteria bacterium]|nr:ribbon-helix-helix protein, CopG family [Deltaproteobacteria bacterium]
MRTLSVKLDDYVVDLLNKEAKLRKSTRMELIRASILDFLINKDDAADLAYIEKHREDELLSFEEVFED